MATIYLVNASELEKSRLRGVAEAVVNLGLRP